MGSGSKFDSTLSTRGGRANMVTEADIKNGDAMAKNIIQEMNKEGIKFAKEKIVFVIKLENGSKVFLESGALCHIIERHGKQFERCFGLSDNELGRYLADTIAKGVLLKSSIYYKGNLVGSRNEYYYQGQYLVVYGIASNGYIETAYPRKMKGN